MHIYNQTRTSDENHNKKKEIKKKKAENIAEKKREENESVFKCALMTGVSYRFSNISRKKMRIKMKKDNELKPSPCSIRFLFFICFHIKVGTRQYVTTYTKNTLNGIKNVCIAMELNSLMIQ